jgi:hypothetical protein
MSAADRRTVGEILAELDRLIGERYDWMDGEMADARDCGFRHQYEPTPEESALWDALWDLLDDPAQRALMPSLEGPWGAREYARVLLGVPGASEGNIFWHCPGEGEEWESYLHRLSLPPPVRDWGARASGGAGRV